MCRQRWGILVLVACAVFSHAQQRVEALLSAPGASPIQATDKSIRLPVQRVVLYKNGVGYFEHSAKVRGDQELAIDFTTAQLNDVLKSLTMVDLGEGRIT